MSVQIKMPALSSTADEGKLAKWLVREGQRVRAGDILAEVETDEAIIEIEAVEEGTILKLLVAEGTAAIKVNAPIATLEQSGGGLARGEAARDPFPSASPPASAAPTRAAPDAPQVSRLGGHAVTPVAPTAIVRTRFKSALVSGANPIGRVSPAAPTAVAGAAMQTAQPKTTFVRAQDVQTDPVAGWLVVVTGPGRGGFRPLFVGMNAIGRDPSQRVSLNFGDDTISRVEHAFITYDEESRRFFIQHGGKANLIRLGTQPVLIPTELKSNDRIRIGKTTLRFVPCCGPDFSWSDEA